MAQDEAPVNFRCQLCEELAVDAFKTICCNQSICAGCHSSLNDTCLLCAHSPISKDDCKPHMGLRKSIKAFLKKKQKAEAPQVQPQSSKTSAEKATNNDSTEQKTEVVSSHVEIPLEETEASTAPKGDDVQDIATDAHVQDVEASKEHQTQEAFAEPAESVDMEEDGSDASSVLIRVSPPPGDSEEAEAQNSGNQQDVSESKSGDMQYNNQDGTGNFNGMNNFANFNGWGMNGAMNGMNGMNPMMAMQNGMGNFDAMQNMMNMGGMMNPAMMQQMQNMMNFGGFNGMGMNQMNGMNGMGGMNMGHMNFDNGLAGWGMPNGMGNTHMNGDFGNDGYLQGPRNNRGNFGRGRGRNEYFQRGRFRGQQYGPQGAHGRKSSFHNDPSSSHAEQPHQVNLASQRRSTKFDENEERRPEITMSNAKGSTSADDETGKDILKKYSLRRYTENLENKTDAQAVSAPESHDDARTIDVKDNESPLNDLEVNVKSSETEKHPEDLVQSRDGEVTNWDTNTELAQELTLSLGPHVPQGPAAQFAPSDSRGRGHGRYRGHHGASFDGHGSSRSFDPVNANAVNLSPAKPTGVGVVGAPTGPKALREGGPNIGFRGRGNKLINTRGGRGAGLVGQNSTINASTTSPTKQQHSSSFESRQDQPHSPNEIRSPRRYSQPSRDNKDVSDYEYDRDYDRKRDRKYEDRIYEEDYRTGERRREDRESDVKDHRSRHEREKHRSSRYDRDRSDERRKRRHRDRSVDNDQHRGNYDEGREETYETNHRHRGDSHRNYRDDSYGRADRRHSAVENDIDPRMSQAPSSAPTGPAPKREFKIAGRSRQTEIRSRPEKSPASPSDFELAKQRIREEKPDVDVYTLEREARQRERLLKEQQRRGSYATGSGNGHKRGYEELEAFDGSKFDTENETRNGRKKSKYESDGRRTSHKYENSQDLAAMMDRAERERERARY